MAMMALVVGLTFVSVPFVQADEKAPAADKKMEKTDKKAEKKADKK